MQKTAIIIGAGPAGLTAALELLRHTDIKPIIFEASGDIGGISKTINYKGNRIDIGGHRFFSKSKQVMDWWFEIMPLQGKPSSDDLLLQRDVKLSQLPQAPDPEKSDVVMLFRNRLSRIFFLRKFFSYPVTLSFETLSNLGIVRVIKIVTSYALIRIAPIKDEKSLEDFFINRFGKELYKTFFKDYTEKLWGIPCNKIKADWGAQRIKGLSISKAILHAIKQVFSLGSGKNVETSLIDSFFYPKFGPGQLWEEVAKLIIEKGGEINFNCEVKKIESEGSLITKIEVKNTVTGANSYYPGDYFFSTMAIKDFFEGLSSAPQEIKSIATNLQYRDFITVGLLLNKLKVTNQTKIKTLNNLIPDTWIYIQEPDVKMCRLQIFNNWSPYMVSDPKKVWIGLEYVCSELDDIWGYSESKMAEFGMSELEKIGIIDRSEVIDSTVIKIKKAYPSYSGSYENFEMIKGYLNKFENLFCIGRNGMHRYNNSDHSMMTAITAVENIKNNIKSKDNIWTVNTEKEYHETKK